MDKDLEPHSFKAFPTQTSQTGLENKEPTAVYNGNPYNLDLGVPPELPQALGDMPYDSVLYPSLLQPLGTSSGAAVFVQRTRYPHTYEVGGLPGGQ